MCVDQRGSQSSLHVKTQMVTSHTHLYLVAKQRWIYYAENYKSISIDAKIAAAVLMIIENFNSKTDTIHQEQLGIRSKLIVVLVSHDSSKRFTEDC